MRLHLIFNQNNEDDNHTRFLKDYWDRFLSIKSDDGQLREISD